jgi:mycothiol synthase
MSNYTLSPYQGGDFDSVVSLLARCLTADSMTPALFTRKVLLDPNFDPAGAPVARVGREVVGFLLGLARRRPLEDGPDDRDRGYITLLAVDEAHRRKRVGTALLEQTIGHLRQRGCKTVLVSPYAPNYWIPGVDMAAYPEALAYFEKHGFQTLYRPLAMDASLAGGWRIPDWLTEREAKLNAEGLRVETFHSRHVPALTEFLREEFPGDWQRYIRETMQDITLGRRSTDDLIVAYDRENVIGFSQHEAERFGPFGVAASQRGRGIGAVLLFRTLEIMRRKGLHNAWFLWTDDANAQRVYSGAGFRETRRFAVLKRDLQESTTEAQRHREGL